MDMRIGANGLFTVATIALIAKELLSKRIQVLTYNNRLKVDTRVRLEHYKENTSVHTFHGFVRNRYGHPANDDKQLEEFLNKYTRGFGLPVDNQTISPIDILIIDECQDLDLLLYELVQRIRFNLRAPPQLVILGDQKQVKGFRLNASYSNISLNPIGYLPIQIFRLPLLGYGTDVIPRYQLRSVGAIDVEHQLPPLCSNGTVHQPRFLTGKPHPRVWRWTAASLPLYQCLGSLEKDHLVREGYGFDYGVWIQ